MIDLLSWAELVGVEDVSREVVVYASYDVLLEHTAPWTLGA